MDTKENDLPKREDDLPKSIVVILVVLAVVISVLSTFTILSEVNRLNLAPVQKGSPSQTGKIQLQVLNPNEGLKATGKVTFTVLKGE